MAISEEAKLLLRVQGVDNLTAPLREMGSKVAEFGRSILHVGEIAAAGWAFKDMIDTTQQIGTEVLRLSQDLGVSAEEASRLRMAADNLGVSTDGLVRGMSMLSTRLKEVGTKTDPFRQLGVQVTGANGQMKDSLTLLGDIADRFQQMPNSLEKLSMVREFFGRGGEEMMRFLSQGREGIQKFAADADKFGLVFSAQKIQQILAYKLAMNDFRDALDGLKVAAGSALLPVLTQLTTGLVELGQTAIPWVRRAAEVVTPIFMGLWNVLQSVWMVLWRIISTAVSTAQSMGIMSAGAKAAGQGFQWALTLGKELGEQIKRLEPLGETIGKVLAGAAVTMKDEWAAAGHIMGGVIKAIMDIGKGDFKGALADLKQGFKAAGKDMQDMATQTDKLGPGLGTLARVLGTIGAIKLGGSVLGWLGKLWGWVTGLVGGGAAGGVLAELATAFGNVGEAILGGEGLGTALSLLGTAFGEVGAAIVAAIGWPVLIAAAVVAIGALIWANWDKIKKWTVEAWDGIKKYLSEVWAGIKQHVADGLESVRQFFVKTIPGWGKAFEDWAAQTWSHIKEWFASLPFKAAEHIAFVAGYLHREIPKQWTAFTTWLNDTWKSIVQWFKDLPGRVTKGVNEFGAWLGEVIPKEWTAFTTWLDDTWTNIVRWLKDLPGKLMGAVREIGNELMSIGAEVGNSIWSGITGSLGWLGDELKKGIGALKKAGEDAAAGWKQGWQEGEAAAGGPPVKHAAGGIFPGPTLIGGHLFGEAGPEALIPLTRGNLARYGVGGLGGGTVNVNVYVQGSLIHERDLKRELTQLVKDGLFQELKLQKQMAF